MLVLIVGKFYSLLEDIIRHVESGGQTRSITSPDRRKGSPRSNWPGFRGQPFGNRNGRRLHVGPLHGKKCFKKTYNGPKGNIRGSCVGHVTIDDKVFLVTFTIIKGLPAPMTLSHRFPEVILKICANQRPKGPYYY